MFHIADCALTAAELGVFEDACQIDRDGCIWYPGRKRMTARTTFNACDLFLWWAVADTYGVQRVRLGSELPLSRAMWGKRMAMGGADQHLTRRRRDVRATFPAEHVEFKTLGWHLLSVEFWRPGSAVLARELPPAKVTDGPPRIRAPLETATDE